MQKNNSIELNELSILYNDLKIGLEAVSKVSFDVKKGEFISIVGPSGCGKSTILKVISDTLDLSYSETKGEVKVLGRTPKIAREERKIGFVFQKPTLLQWRNLEKNVSLPLEIIGLNKSEIKKRVKKLLKMVELEKYASYHPDQLSGGMQQKVSIARALAYDPEILLMDEPFGALDEINRRKMNDELLAVWNETEKTIVFVTHSIEEAIYLSQRIIVLTKQPGRIKKIINVELPYPRKKELGSMRFYKYINQIRSLLENEEEIV